MDQEQAAELLEGGTQRTVTDGLWPGSIGSSVLPGISKISEECSELGEVICKIWGSGGLEHWKGDLKESLEDEMADVVAAIWFVRKYNDLDLDRMNARAAQKVALFEKWHHEAQSK